MFRATEDGQEFRTIPVTLIDPNPDNPRENWDAQHVERMVPSVRRFGLLQPVVVRPIADGRYELVAGERRLRAAKKAGLADVICAVRAAGEADALSLMLVENVQRRALSHLETARLMGRLCAPRDQGGAGLCQRKAAALLGKSRQWANMMLALLKLPEAWQQKLARGEINRRQAYKLVVHRDSSELLARVEADMAANPWAWRSDQDFTRSLDLLLAAPVDARRRSPRAVQAPRTDGKTPARMAADELAAIVAAVGTVPTIADLQAVQAAVARRRLELRRTKG